MATRTEPMRIAPFLYSSVPEPGLGGGPRGVVPPGQQRGRVVGTVPGGTTELGGGLSVRPSLGGDQLIQPANLTLYRLKPVPLQLKRVAIEPLPGPCECGAERLDSLLKPAAPAFQDPQPDVGPGKSEKSKPDTEPVVLPGRGPG